MFGRFLPALPYGIFLDKCKSGILIMKMDVYQFLPTFMSRASSNCFVWCLSTALCITSSTLVWTFRDSLEFEQQGQIIRVRTCIGRFMLLAKTTGVEKLWLTRTGPNLWSRLSWRFWGLKNPKFDMTWKNVYKMQYPPKGPSTLSYSKPVLIGPLFCCLTCVHPGWEGSNSKLTVTLDAVQTSLISRHMV